MPVPDAWEPFLLDICCAGTCADLIVVLIGLCIGSTLQVREVGPSVGFHSADGVRGAGSGAVEHKPRARHKRRELMPELDTLRHIFAKHVVQWSSFVNFKSTRMTMQAQLLGLVESRASVTMAISCCGRSRTFEKSLGQDWRRQNSRRCEYACRTLIALPRSAVADSGGSDHDLRASLTPDSVQEGRCRALRSSGRPWERAHAAVRS